MRTTDTCLLYVYTYTVLNKAILLVDRHIVVTVHTGLPLLSVSFRLHIKYLRHKFVFA